MTDLGLIVVAVFLILVVLRVPVFIALAFPPILYMLFTGHPLFVAAQNMARSLDVFSLIAVPLFIYVGSLLNHSGVADKIFDFANNMLGHISGGLAHVNIFSSLIFSGISGSALADIGGIGRVLINTMKDNGYSNSYSSALTCSAATIGPLFPPSIPLIIFGVLASVSVLDLLLAGLVPALVLFVGMIALTAVLSRVKEFPKYHSKPNRKTVMRSFVVTLPALGAPVVLIGGMLSGYFGVTEIAAVTVVYVIGINVVFYSNYHVDYIWESAKEAAQTTAVILVLLAAAGLFAHIITLEGTHRTLGNALFSISTNPIMLLLIVNLLLLLLGLFLEPLSAMLISIPLVVPTLTQVGVDPVHIGVIMVFNLMIGLLTPPLGLSLFLASDIADSEYEDTVRELVPYYALLIVTLLVITFIPALSLWVPDLV